MAANSEKYRNRIDAINFSLAHDDGQFVNQLDQADVILLGVSRCGKTPTSLYLAMQYAVKAANFRSPRTISSAARCPRPSRRTAASCSACRSSPSGWPRCATSAAPTAITRAWSNAATKWPRPSA